jgi:arginyl-tRNA synthetase
MKRHVDALVREALRDAIVRGRVRSRGEVAFQVEPPRHGEFGDLACDVGLVLARALGESPHELAAAVVDRLQDPHGWLAAVTIGGPGFVNFRLSLAFWRTMLAEALAAGPDYGRARAGAAGRALVDVVADGDSQTVRAWVLARALVAVLRETGWNVAEAAAGDAPGIDLAVAVLVPTRSDAVARFRAALAGSPALRVIGVRPVRTGRDGEPVDGALVRGEPGDSARLLMLLERADRAVDLDLEQAASGRTDNPGFLVRLARERLVRIVAAGSPAAAGAACLGDLAERDVEVLRAVAAWPDVVEVAAQTLEPDRVARYLVQTAMGAHRWVNRHRLLGGHAPVPPARAALAGCLERILSRAAALCGMSVTERP